jgi:hypothetical protein
MLTLKLQRQRAKQGQRGTLKRVSPADVLSDENIKIPVGIRYCWINFAQTKHFFIFAILFFKSNARMAE